MVIPNATPQADIPRQDALASNPTNAKAKSESVSTSKSNDSDKDSSLQDFLQALRKALGKEEAADMQKLPAKSGKSLEGRLEQFQALRAAEARKQKAKPQAEENAGEQTVQGPETAFLAAAAANAPVRQNDGEGGKPVFSVEKTETKDSGNRNLKRAKQAESDWEPLLQEEEGVLALKAVELSPAEKVSLHETALKEQNQDQIGATESVQAETAKLDSVKSEPSANNEPLVLVADRRPIDNQTARAAMQENQPANVIVRQALAENGNAEIVQRAHFILKDQDIGEIRLLLRPENLGSVRINLSMEDNRVLGRIIVDNNAVKQAFDDNMSDLRDSFLKSGYNAQLDVSVGGKGASNGQTFSGQNQNSTGFLSSRLKEGGNAFEEAGLQRIAVEEILTRRLNVQA